MDVVGLCCDLEGDGSGTFTLTIRVSKISYAEACEISEALHDPVRQTVLDIVTKGGQTPFRVDKE